MTRRHSLLLAGSTLAAQKLPPVEELVNTFEMEAMARRQLAPAAFAGIGGSERGAFDRITLRPRLMVNTLALDLSIELFGQSMFAPILIGPVSGQARFHPDGEQAMLAGAAAAKCAVVFPAPAERLSPVWAQVDPARPAIPPSAKVLVVTGPFAWADFDRLRKATKVPLVVKGVMSPPEAQLAAKHGADGIVVSNYRASGTPGLAQPIAVLPSIATEINNRIPVLIDGGFRRGSDILKALALGARAVLVGRPALWGLAAYGARGVQQVMEQLQTELARDMAMCGKVTLKDLGPDVVRIHRR